MKRNLILAGCLLLCAGCAEKERSWSLSSHGPEKCIGSDGRSAGPVPCITYSGTTDSFISGNAQGENSNWIVPEAQQTTGKQKWQYPMVAPTMHDVVTHSQEFGCDKDHELWWMHNEIGIELPVCVTPAFITQLKKANGEQKQ